MPVLGLTTDLGPVLVPYVVVDLHPGAFTVEPIRPADPASRDPVLLTCLDVDVVRLVAGALQALERPAAVVQGLAALGERHAPDARRTRESAGLAFDVHDPAL